MDEREVSADEITSWYTPIEACAYAARIVGRKGAHNAIWERLEGGMIEAAASSSSSTVRDCSPVPDFRSTLIPRRYWKFFSNMGSDLWGAGDARFFLSSRGSKSTTVKCFGIKLNPADVHATLPPLPLEPEEPEEPAGAAEIEQTPEVDQAVPAAKGPPVSDELLRAWYELYCRAYQGPADTLENACKSACGMFPGKFVSRDRVRKLCGGRKRGRKSGSTDA